jgi:hypothetical protein
MRVMMTMVVAAALSGIASARAADGPEALMREVFEKPSPRTETAILDIENVGPDGRRENRVMGLEKIGRTKRLFYFREPADLRGMAVLGIDQDGRRDRWLYVPAARATRRIAGTQQRDAFMDTQFSYEDVDDRRFDEYDYAAAGSATVDGVPVTLIDARPRDPGSGYGRVRFQIDPARNVVVGAELFDPSGAHIKTAVFRRFEEVGGYLLPGEFEMRSLRDGRTSFIRVRERTVDEPLEESRFSPAFLPRIR